MSMMYITCNTKNMIASIVTLNSYRHETLNYTFQKSIKYTPVILTIKQESRGLNYNFQNMMWCQKGWVRT